MPALGEWAGAQRWSNGLPPRPRPLPVLVGSADCIQFGEKYPDPAAISPEGATCDAYPSECFGIAQAQRAAYDISCCGTQQNLAKVLNTSYTDMTLAITQLDDFLVGPFTYFAVPNSSSVVPGVLIAIGPIVLVIIPGTTNFQQLAFQILYLTTGPVNVGPFSTNVAWFGAALQIEQRIRDAGYTTQTDFYFVGHSYGGAIAQILAARMALNRPDVMVNLMTFGAPAAGDFRLRELLDGARQRNFVIDLDPVPGMPPRLGTLFSVTPIIGPLLSLIWTDLVPPGSRILLGEFGDQVESDDEFLATALTYEISQLVFAAMPTPLFSAHFMQNYLRRLGNGCLPPKKGKYSYKVTTVGLIVSDGVSTFDLSGSAEGSYDGTNWGGSGLGPTDLAWLMHNDNDYPNGAGFTLQVYGIDSVGPLPPTTFLLPDAEYQADTFTTDPPIPAFGWTIVAFTSMALEFVHVADDAFVNGADIFP